MTNINTIEQKKKKRKRLHVYPRNLLAISGILQISFLQVHIEAIIRIQNVIIGFYLLSFILATTINILNGFGFSTKPNLAAILGTAFVTFIQIIFGILYTSLIVIETNMFSSQHTLPVMIVSVIFFILGILSALAALFFEIKVFRHADEIYQYMM
jgi:hypothetical protein